MERQPILGGPRKEFFRIAVSAIREHLLEEGDDGKVRLKKDERQIAHKVYYYAALITGLSILQGGECPEFVYHLLNELTSSEESHIHQFRMGLKTTGILQLCEETRTFKYLFSTQEVDLNVGRLLQIFNVKLSEAGSSARQREERVYGAFIKYLRAVYAGRRNNVRLENILQFCTGATKVPVLGFAMEPSIEFSEVPMPMASTCVNKLILPTNINENFEDLCDMSFVNDYFGII